MDLFKDVLPSLNQKTSHLLDENPRGEKLYPAYMVNKAFAQGDDTLLYANEMNKNHFLPNKLQYDFYFYALDKRKRFNKWSKPETINNIEIIKEYYHCSNQKAKEYAAILTKEQIDTIKSRLFTGEIVKM